MKAGIRAIAWFVLKWLIRIRFPIVKRLTTTELAHQLESDVDSTNGQHPILLDARTFEEYQVSHLPGARWVDMNDPVDYLLDYGQGDRLNSPSPPSVVIYCSIGYRSAQLTQQLQARGHKNVVNLEGSIFAWINENRPVYRNATPVCDIHPYHDAWKWLLNPNSHPTTQIPPSRRPNK
ncbi:MAG: rhodanese-like domain-containing protein [Elainellaceae cyanobacterium]